MRKERKVEKENRTKTERKPKENRQRLTDHDTKNLICLIFGEKKKIFENAEDAKAI